MAAVPAFTSAGVSAEHRHSRVSYSSYLTLEEGPMAAAVASEIQPPVDVPARQAVDVDTEAGRLGLQSLPDRDLDAQELRALAADIAAHPETWAHLVRFDDEDRAYASLHRDAHVDVWLLCWTPRNDTGWHDHDVSSGAVAVVSGELAENNLTLTAGDVETRIPAGKAFCFGPDHIHRLAGVRHASVSVPAYSPPLSRMGQYTVTDAGVLRRISVSYAEELRPLD